MTSKPEDRKQKLVRMVIKSLEEIDDLVLEAGEKALWYQQKYDDRITLPIDKVDLKRLKDARQVYESEHRTEDMIHYLEETPTYQRAFDATIASITKIMDKTIHTERGKWIYWHYRMERAGETAWKKLVHAARPIGETAIDALVVKFGSLDMILELLEARLGIGGERVGFASELIDTMQVDAMIELRKKKGKYVPLDMNEVNRLKDKLRRKRQREAEGKALSRYSGSSSIRVFPIRHPNDSQIRKAPQSVPSIPTVVISADESPTASPPVIPIAKGNTPKWSWKMQCYVVVMFATILAAVPGFKAWQYSRHKVGTTRDAHFWYILQGTIIQIVANFTIILPLIWNRKVRLQRWIWTWLLIFVSFWCAIAAIPLYLHFPSEWSVAVSFVSSVATLFVTLQAMFIIQEDKDE